MSHSGHLLLHVLYMSCTSLVTYFGPGRELASFGGVVKQMLEDVQQRIVFRAQRYIQTDIRGYNPAPGDLAYPDKLIVASEATTVEETTASDSDSVFDTSGTEVCGLLVYMYVHSLDALES